jgi:YD repeat-containing protein
LEGAGRIAGALYDANGNMTYDGDKQSYEWDAANRLVAIMVSD